MANDDDSCLSFKKRCWDITKRQKCLPFYDSILIHLFSFVNLNLFIFRFGASVMCTEIKMSISNCQAWRNGKWVEGRCWERETRPFVSRSSFSVTVSLIRQLSIVTFLYATWTFIIVLSATFRVRPSPACLMSRYLSRSFCHSLNFDTVRGPLYSLTLCLFSNPV